MLACDSDRPIVKSRASLVSILVVVAISVLGGWAAWPTIQKYNHYPPDFDEAVHLLPALQIANDLRSVRVADLWRHTYSQDQIAAYPFLHSWLLAPFFVLWQPGISTGRAIGLVLLGISSVVVFFLARLLSARFSWLSGLVGALLTLFCMTLWAYASLAYLEAAGLLVTLLGLWCYVKAVPGENQRRWLIGASLFTAGALWTKYSFGVFLAGSIALNEVAGAFTTRQWPSRKRLAYLVGPFVLCVAFWFADPGKLDRFLVYSQSQRGQLAFWSAANLLYYPENLIRYYAAGPLSTALILAGLVAGLLAWRQHGARALLVYLAFSLVALVMVPQKAGRFLYTVAPAAFALAGPPVAQMMDWLTRRGRRRWLQLASVGLIVGLCALEARAIVSRFSLYDAAVEVNYASSPDTRAAYHFVLENTLAKDVRPHILNGWHLFNGYAVEWEYYTVAGGDPAAHDYQLATMGLAPEPTDANLNTLIRSLRDRGMRALVSIDGSPVGQYTGWQVIEPLLSRGELDTHPEHPTYTLFEWQSDYIDRVYAGAFASHDEFEQARRASKVEFPITIHLYYLRP